MEQTASNEMSNLSELTDNNISQDWNVNIPDPSGNFVSQDWNVNIPDPSGNFVSQDWNVNIPDSSGNENMSDPEFDVDSLVIMIKENNVDNIDKSNLLKDFCIYKLILQDEMIIENHYPYVYKNKTQFNFFKNLLTIFAIKKEDIESKLDNPKILEIFFLLIKYIIKIDKGQYLLKMFPYEQIIKKLILKEEYSVLLYFMTGVSSTLPVFIEVDKFFTNKSYLDDNYKSILSAACRNSDVRVLKYIINNFNDYHKPTWNNANFIKKLISQVFSFHIPVKHSLRRIKMISSKINLAPYFNYMVDVVPDLDTLMTLKKYYYTDSFRADSNNICSLTNLLFISEEKEINKDTINQALSILTKNYEKADLMLNIFTRTKTLFDIDISEYIDINYPGLEKNVSLIVDNIFNDYLENDSYKVYNTSDLKLLFEICQPNISRYMHAKYIKKLIFMMPFIDFFPTSSSRINNPDFKKLGCQLNYIKYTIKIWLRRNHKVLKLENKIKKIRLMNDTNHRGYNKNLIRGSVQYQLFKQKFTKLPPRHILPLELNGLTETDEGLYLIREKADGCMVDFISKDVEPIIPEYSSNSIKAEFIEELDLYLIFDINLDNTGYIYRYNYLRNLHPSTKDARKLDNTYFIESFDQLKEEIKKERIRFQKFLREPYKNYRVYPKATWIIKSIDDSINKELIHNIVEEHDYKYICEAGDYLNDGLIISPLDGRRELKLKPKSMHTLDLLYDGRNWVDRENTKWNHIIKSDSLYTPNTIWRCYPTFDKIGDYYIFEPKEYRFDKSKPNKYNIINMIYKLHIIDWNKLSDNCEKYFYHSESYNMSTNWKNIKDCQNNHLVHVLDKIEPIVKSKWLDLGCGSSKLLKFIKKYNPIKYIGLDVDINQLLKAVDRIDSNQVFLNNSQVIPCDLQSLWNSHPLAWDSVDMNEKYDYIISNFSLSHYHSSIFWEQLNEVSKENTIFIFNVINKNAMKKWVEGDSYLYIEDKTVKYMFESIHNHEMTEQYIDEDEIVKYSKKFNWNTMHKITPIGDKLDSYYTWYVLKHI